MSLNSVFWGQSRSVPKNSVFNFILTHIPTHSWTHSLTRWLAHSLFQADTLGILWALIAIPPEYLLAKGNPPRNLYRSKSADNLKRKRKERVALMVRANKDAWASAEIATFCMERARQGCTARPVQSDRTLWCTLVGHGIVSQSHHGYTTGCDCGWSCPPEGSQTYVETRTLGAQVLNGPRKAQHVESTLISSSLQAFSAGE